MRRASRRLRVVWSLLVGLLGLRANGMPVGATLIGRSGDDAGLLGYAFAFEQATRLRVDPPGIGRDDEASGEREALDYRTKPT